MSTPSVSTARRASLRDEVIAKGDGVRGRWHGGGKGWDGHGVGGGGGGGGGVAQRGAERRGGDSTVNFKPPLPGERTPNRVDVHRSDALRGQQQDAHARLSAQRDVIDEAAAGRHGRAAARYEAVAQRNPGATADEAWRRADDHSQYAERLRAGIESRRRQSEHRAQQERETAHRARTQPAKAPTVQQMAAPSEARMTPGQKAAATRRERAAALARGEEVPASKPKRAVMREGHTEGMTAGQKAAATRAANRAAAIAAQNTQAQGAASGQATAATPAAAAPATPRGRRRKPDASNFRYERTDMSAEAVASRAQGNIEAAVFSERRRIMNRVERGQFPSEKVETHMAQYRSRLEGEQRVKATARAEEAKKESARVDAAVERIRATGKGSSPRTTHSTAGEAPRRLEETLRRLGADPKGAWRDDPAAARSISNRINGDEALRTIVLNTPRHREIIREQTRDLPPDQRDAILAQYGMAPAGYKAKPITEIVDGLGKGVMPGDVATWVARLDAMIGPNLLRL